MSGWTVGYCVHKKDPAGEAESWWKKSGTKPVPLENWRRLRGNFNWRGAPFILRKGTLKFVRQAFFYKSIKGLLYNAVGVARPNVSLSKSVQYACVQVC